MLNLKKALLLLTLLSSGASAVESSSTPHPADIVLRNYLKAELESSSLFEFCARTRPFVVKAEDYPDCPPHESSEIVSSNRVDVKCAANQNEYRCAVRYVVVAGGGIQAGGDSAWTVRPESRRFVETKTFVLNKEDDWKISDPYVVPHVALDALLKRLVNEKEFTKSPARLKQLETSIHKLQQLKVKE